MFILLPNFFYSGVSFLKHTRAYFFFPILNVFWYFLWTTRKIYFILKKKIRRIKPQNIAVNSITLQKDVIDTYKPSNINFSHRHIIKISIIFLRLKARYSFQ